MIRRSATRAAILETALRKNKKRKKKKHKGGTLSGQKEKRVKKIQRIAQKDAHKCMTKRENEKEKSGCETHPKSPPELRVQTIGYKKKREGIRFHFWTN